MKRNSLSFGGRDPKLLESPLGNSHRVAFAGLCDLKYFLGNDFGDRIGAIYQFKRTQGILVCRSYATYFFRSECRTLQQSIEWHNYPALLRQEQYTINAKI